MIIEDETSKVEYARYDVHKSHMKFASAFFTDYLTEYPDLESVKLTVPNESYVNAVRDLLRSAYGAEVEFTTELVELVMKYQFQRCARDMCLIGFNHYDVYCDAVVKLKKLNMLCMMASGETLWTLEDGELKGVQEKALDLFYEDYAYCPSWEDGEVVAYLCKELSFRSLYDFLKNKDDGKSCMDGDAILVAKWCEYHKSHSTDMVDMMRLIDVFRLTPSYRSWWVNYIMLIDDAYFRSVLNDVARGRKNGIDVWKGERIFTLTGKDIDYCHDVTAEKYMPNCTFDYDGDDAYLNVCFAETNDRLTTTFNHEITFECTIIIKLKLMSFDKKHIYASYRCVKGCDDREDVSFELGWDLKSIGLKDDETYVLICGYDFVYNAGGLKK